MTDDERLQRLTELARRVWPDRDASVSVTDPSDYDASECWPACVVLSPDAEWENFLGMPEHPRKLDALEAALLALLGDEKP